jgi:hypothetical protein
MKTLLRRAGLLGAAALLLVLAPGLSLAQCSLCRDAVASSSAETREAMNYAIIGLAFAPYGVAAMAVWALSPTVRARVRARFKRFMDGNAGAPL